MMEKISKQMSGMAINIMNLLDNY